MCNAADRLTEKEKKVIVFTKVRTSAPHIIAYSIVWGVLSAVSIVRKDYLFGSFFLVLYFIILSEILANRFWLKIVDKLMK